MSVILMTTLFYKALILQEEIWSWPLLGLKGLRERMKRWLTQGSSGRGRIDSTQDDFSPYNGPKKAETRGMGLRYIVQPGKLNWPWKA